MSNGLQGHLAHFGLDDATGTLRDISAFLNNIQVSRSNDQSDSSSFGDLGHTFQNGLTNGTITITGWYDVTALVGPNVVLKGLLGLQNTTSSFEHGPLGTSTGKPKETGECTLVSYEKTIPVADIITFTATLNISGSVTDGVY